MPKKPLSVTLDEQNLLWLRGRAAATRRRSLSEALDAVVTAARTGGAGSVAARSVVATIDIAPDDPLLGQADAAVTAMVTASLGDGLGGGETESAPQDEGVVVAERAAVTDTHALIFHAAGGAHLGKKARAMFAAAESGQALIYVPAAVMWEVGLLARLVKINLRRSTREFFGDLFSNPAYQPCDLTPSQVLEADELRFTRDPFDGLIVACARDLRLPLLTRDVAIADANVVRVLW